MKAGTNWRWLSGVLAIALLGQAPAVWTADEPPADSPRSYRMGFSLTSPPLRTLPEYFKRFDVWVKRADAAITHHDMPWKALLAGTPPETIVREDLLKQVEFLRQHRLLVIITLDPLNGTDRRKEATDLVAAGRSITEPEIQRLYREYALAVARLTQPDYLGLAAEVNMFKAMASGATYNALVRMTRVTAKEIQQAYPQLPLYVSLQVEQAWQATEKPGAPKSFAGVGGAYEDFPFMTAVGLSVYPFLGWVTPEVLPDAYLSRMLEGRHLPVLIAESGWPSRSYGSLRSSTKLQARWIRRLGQLADGVQAVAVTQLLFSDFEDWIPQVGILPLFSTQGLVNKRLHPKPALAEWDRLFQRPITEGK